MVYALRRRRRACTAAASLSHGYPASHGCVRMPPCQGPTLLQHRRSRHPRPRLRRSPVPSPPSTKRPSPSFPQHPHRPQASPPAPPPSPIMAGAGLLKPFLLQMRGTYRHWRRSGCLPIVSLAALNATKAPGTMMSRHYCQPTPTIPAYLANRKLLKMRCQGRCREFESRHPLHPFF